MSRRHARGFTLLELLVALAVFSLVSVMAYSGLRAVLDADQQTGQRAERLRHLQAAVGMLERDLLQATTRGIRDQYGEMQPPLSGVEVGAHLLELTRAGWTNPTGSTRSGLQRIAYGLRGEQLVRLAWLVLDRAQDSVPYEAALLDGVRDMRLRYLDAQREWQPNWPPRLDDGTLVMELPLAVEVVLEVEGWGEIRRLLPLPQGLPLRQGSTL